MTNLSQSRRLPVLISFTLMNELVSYGDTQRMAFKTPPLILRNRINIIMLCISDWADKIIEEGVTTNIGQNERL
eukprot:scaffold7767_cov86-Skeletonema_dohrnii-CCMP3373.AAC.2